MSSIHAQRAKRWGTNPFIAEWLANAVEFCHRDPLGEADFEHWVMTRYGPVQGKLQIKACHVPPRKKYGKLSGDTVSWNAAGVELGVSEEAVQLYHQYTAGHNICVPERVVPGPKRKRGESSVDWLAFISADTALLDGAKPPNFDWQTARAIAISEADKIRDLSETWRTNPTAFLQSIETRGESTIPSPEILDRDPEYKKFHNMNDALRSLMLIHTIGHMTWSHAVELFEDLATMGLTSASSIERAYRKDRKLLWRLCACFANVTQLYNAMLGKFTHVVTYSPHFRPYFKRWRQSDGTARIQKNRSYIEKHGFNGSMMDEVIVNMFDEVNNQASGFFDYYTKALQTDPEEANKFSQEAYDEMGDLAIVHEFMVNISESSFGQRLVQYGLAQPLDPLFYSEVVFMDPAKFNHTPFDPPIRSIGQTSDMTAAMCDQWQQCTHTLNIWDMFPKLVTGAGIHFDEMWFKIDLHLWTYACKMLDKPTEPGRVAKTFGLIDPLDQDRPTFVLGRIFQDEESDDERKPEPETTPAPAANPGAIPKFPAANTVAQSVHSYLAGTQEDRPKEKVKTRGTATSDTKHSGDSDEDGWSDGEGGGLRSYPLILPPNFKMGRNVLKIFHRILDLSFEVNGDSKDAPKKGQIRWGDFEKAMKRIGFTVIQTAGSSVRFDPPAQTARPITFHRPHPDSTMTPILIKWVGARLNRCYGWTKATFMRGEAEE